MNKIFRDVYGKVVTINDKVIYNLSGSVVRGKVLDILPNYVKIELTFPVEYNEWDYASPFYQLEKGHCSKVKNLTSILLDI